MGAKAEAKTEEGERWTFLFPSELIERIMTTGEEIGRRAGGVQLNKSQVVRMLIERGIEAFGSEKTKR